MRLNEWILVTTTADNDNGANPETHGGNISATPVSPNNATLGDGFSVATLRQGVNDEEAAGSHQGDLSYGNFNVFRTQKTMTGGMLTFAGQLSSETDPDNSLSGAGADKPDQFVSADVIMLVRVD